VGRYSPGPGPFLYCDYWASVFNLEGVVSPAVLAGGRLSLGQFRRAIDRPRTRLPALRYYILAFVFLPVLMPYRVVYDIMRLVRGRAKRLGHPVDDLMGRHRLHVEPATGGRVQVTAAGRTVGEGLIDPRAAQCAVSLFYPTYKFLGAGLLAVVLSLTVLPHLGSLAVLRPLGAHLTGALYLFLALLLLVLLRDPLTAAVAPLPIVAFRHLWQLPESVSGLALFSVGFILLFFVVEWFLIPRGLPPTLFLYVNDPGSPAYPYAARGHAPTWLRGERYWVWRFVTLVPGELLKFWERDWERVECWIRADGPDAGRLEWVVGDAHYRELWYDYTRLTAHREASDHERVRARSDGGLEWVVEVDMDPIFHAPYVRAIALYPEGQSGSLASLPRLFAALWGGVRRDRLRPVAPRIEELEADGTELFADIPEHFRKLVAFLIVGMPWSFWRYARGAGTGARRFLYGAPGANSVGLAAEAAHQIKHGPARAAVVHAAADLLALGSGDAAENDAADGTADDAEDDAEDGTQSGAAERAAAPAIAPLREAR
jgi:hypothetical protein